MIRLARPADVEALWPGVRALVAALNAQGNDQWSPAYPTVDHFRADCRAQTLFVDDEGGIRGLVTLDTREPDGYQTLGWTLGQPALNVHRLAVLPGFHRRGIAEGLLAFAEDRARAQGLDGLKSDTAVVNDAMNALFAKRGWRPIGTLNFSDATVTFNAWEKRLDHIRS